MPLVCKRALPSHFIFVERALAEVSLQNPDQDTGPNSAPATKIQSCPRSSKPPRCCGLLTGCCTRMIGNCRVAQVARMTATYGMRKAQVEDTGRRCAMASIGWREPVEARDHAITRK